MASDAPPSSPAFGFVLPGRPPTDGEKADLMAFLPPGVLADFAAPKPPERMPPITLQRVLDIAEGPEIEDCTRLLVERGRRHVAYACGTASYVRGLAGDVDIRERMLGAGAETATTTSSAMLAAMRARGVGRVAVLSPHIDAVNAHLVTFLDEAGIETVALRGMGREGGIEDIPTEEIAALTAKVDSDAADGIYIACTSLRLAGFLCGIEQAVGKLVLAANQVTVWGMLRAGGMDASLTDVNTPAADVVSP